MRPLTLLLTPIVGVLAIPALAQQRAATDMGTPDFKDAPKLFKKPGFSPKRKEVYAATRKPDAATGKLQAVGSTVDVAEAT